MVIFKGKELSTLFCQQLMQNKKQLKLKTVQLNECFGRPKQTILLESRNKTKRQTQYSKVQSNKYCKTQIQNLIKHDKITKNSINNIKQHPLLIKFNDMQINRYDFKKYFCVPTSYETISNYRNFPRRESIIKNTNPFKFFLNGSVKGGRTQTEPSTPNSQQKVIVKNQAKKLKRPSTFNKSRRFTESVRQMNKSTRNTRPQSVSMAYFTKQIKQIDHIIDPWQTIPQNAYTCEF